MQSRGDRVSRKIAVIVFGFIAAPWRAVRGGSLERLGSAYGGWWIPREDSNDMVAYCLGAGEDVTFDLALESKGWFVRTVDPTPRSLEFLETVLPPSGRMRVLPYAAWSTDTTIKLYEPANPAHVSYSALNIQRTTSFIEVPALSLWTMMQRMGDSRIDLLKLDIEGAEHEVLDSLHRLQLVPRILCVEFDAVRPVRRLARTWLRLIRLKYRPFHSEGLNVLFVRTSVLSSPKRRNRS